MKTLDSRNTSEIAIRFAKWIAANYVLVDENKYKHKIMDNYPLRNEVELYEQFKIQHEPQYKTKECTECGTLNYHFKNGVWCCAFCG